MPAKVNCSLHRTVQRSPIKDKYHMAQRNMRNMDSLCDLFDRGLSVFLVKFSSFCGYSEGEGQKSRIFFLCSPYINRHITLFVIIHFLSLAEDTSKTIIVGLVWQWAGNKEYCRSKGKKRCQNQNDRTHFSDTT